jgi:hypothetical protein
LAGDRRTPSEQGNPARGLQMHLEMAYNRKKVVDNAIDGWKVLLDKHPDQRELATRLKTAYEKKGRLKAALAKHGKEDTSADEEIQGWKALVKNHPKTSALQTHLSEAYTRKKGSAAEEIAGWVTLLNLYPDEQDLRDRLLYACLQCGDIEIAMEELRHLNDRGTKNAELPSERHVSAERRRRQIVLDFGAVSQTKVNLNRRKQK